MALAPEQCAAFGERPPPVALIDAYARCRGTRARRLLGTEPPERAPGVPRAATSRATQSARLAPSTPGRPPRPSPLSTQRSGREHSPAASGCGFAPRWRTSRANAAISNALRPAKAVNASGAHATSVAGGSPSSKVASPRIATDAEHRGRRHQPHGASQAPALSACAVRSQTKADRGVNPKSSGLTCGPLDVSIARYANGAHASNGATLGLHTPFMAQQCTRRADHPPRTTCGPTSSGYSCVFCAVGGTSCAHLPSRPGGSTRRT